MLHFFANVHLFCSLLLSSDPVGQFVPDSPPANGNPIIQNGAGFAYNYQIVTSENAIKFREFSPFPQPPQVYLTTVNSLLDLVSNVRKHLTSVRFFTSNCVRQAQPNRYVQL